MGQRKHEVGVCITEVYVELWSIDPRAPEEGLQLFFYIDGKPTTYKQVSMKKADQYRDLCGDKAANVSVGLGEKIGGPYGYSSVDVRVEVTLSCNQDEETIRKAAQAAFDECVGTLENTVGDAVKVLETHLAKYYMGHR